MIRSPHILLLSMVCWAGAAVANDAPALLLASEAPASEAPVSEAGAPLPSPVPPDPQPSPPELALVELRLLWDWGDLSGVRTEGLLSAHRYQLPEGAYLASLALAQQGQTAQAQLELRQLAAAWPGTPLAGAAILAQADALLSSLPDLAVTHYRTYLREFPEGPERARAIAGISAAYAHLGQFPEALDVLRDANLSVPAALQAVVDTPPRWRRPGVAKALAIVPGVGHLYAGSPRPALSAFTVNLVFAAGVAVAVRQESWGTAGVLGFFGLGFYIGNIYGAGEAAMRHNRRIRDGVERSYAQSGILPDSPVLPDERWITPAP